MVPMLCPKCGTPIPHQAPCCPQCGHPAGGKKTVSVASTWRAEKLKKKLRVFVILGIVCALLVPVMTMRLHRLADRLTSADLQQPVGRFDAAILAKKCRNGQSSLQDRTVVADGVPVKARFDGWPLFIRFDGGLVCRLDKDAVEEAEHVVAGANGQRIAVVGIVKGDGISTFLNACRVYAPARSSTNE